MNWKLRAGSLTSKENKHMKLPRKLYLISCLLLIYSSRTLAVGWTAEIEDIRVWDNDKAEIFISNPREPYPAGSTWQCDYNLVLIGDPVSKAMLSTALTAYAANKTIRIDVQGFGVSCSIKYIQTAKQ